MVGKFCCWTAQWLGSHLATEKPTTFGLGRGDGPISAKGSLVALNGRVLVYFGAQPPSCLRKSVC